MSPDAPPIRVLIADDHEVVRKGLALVLRLEPGIQVIGEARDGVEAVRLTREMCPDVLLLDRKMPGGDGETAAKRIRSECPETRILVLSGAEVDEGVLDLIETVNGYVLKDISPDELVHAIRMVAAGGQYIHAAVTRGLLGVVARSAAPAASPPPLSSREMEVLRLMATPATYREIGRTLFIAEETVRSHVKNILVKLDQPNRTQAVVAAVRAGLIHLD